MKLSDLVDFNPKRALKKGVYASFVEMASLPENGRDISNIGNKIFTGNGSKFSNGDTLFARITPCLENGKTSLVSGLLDNEVAFGSTEFIVLSAKEPEYDSNYIYYFSRLSEFRSFAQSRMEGTSGRQRVAWQALADYEYEFPSKAYRKYAGELLKKFDDKILLNHQVNHTLEQMAQSLFKSWFVDFKPVKAKIAVLEAGGSQDDATLAAMTAISGKDANSLAVFEREHPEKYAGLRATAELFPTTMQESELGDIPEGWTIDNLGTIIEFNPKRILKKGINAPYLDMKNVPVKGHSVQDVVCREVTSGTKFKNGDTLLARITPCLENGKTAFVDFLSSNDTVGWGSTEFIVMRVKRDLPLSISYFIARLESFRITAIQSMQGTSGRQRADAGVLQNMPWIIPPDELLVKFGKFSNFVIDNNRVKHNQNTLLSQLRDTLLPKLLSGEITLPEAEEIAKEADYV
ncbi:restriction endonuclease subunit S [Klebsiella variicola subsp. variicola]|uniref:restriction endonuclease subunit S n=1 Tax=Klebsiella variicola TaxID=244366 RepID=UPI00292BB48D|nr:restriction endonuclease subunit S [Klebsiella variicola]MDV1443312.1 restriction endonuclease subunit S [Klebsiella variicola subsp. variicola]